MPPDSGSIAPSSHSGSAIKTIKTAAMTQLINALLPAICALTKGLNSQPDPIIPPAAAINTLAVEISLFSFWSGGMDFIDLKMEYFASLTQSYDNCSII